MPTFIQRIAAKILESDAPLHAHLVVLPNQRAELFLREELRAKLDRSRLMPLFITVDQFITQAANIITPEPLVLLISLHRAYNAALAEAFPEKEPETLGSFMHWGQSLLADFGEIDRYLLTPEHVLGDLYNIQKLNEWSLDIEEQTPMMRRYSDFVALLPQTYEKFTKALLERGEAYAGLAARQLAEHPELLHAYCKKNGIERAVVGGLNALNTAELAVLQELGTAVPTEHLWDLDPHYVDHPQHEAGHFFRQHMSRQKVFGKDVPSTKGMESQWREWPKTIAPVGASQYTGQSRVVAQTLEQWRQAGVDPRDIAVVLADETLLNPVLSLLPEGYDKVNITMGYPLNQTGLASTVLLWLDTVEYAIKKAKKPGNWTYYYRTICALFTDPIFNAYWDGADGPTQWNREIVQGNRVFTSASEWTDRLAAGPEGYHDLLRAATGPELLHGLQRWLGHVGATCKNDPITENTAYHIHTLVEQLARTLEEEWPEDLVLTKLLRQMLKQGSIDFVGEPLEGLQIMGILESRTLDFPYVIVAGVNEGVLPAGRNYNSLLTYDIKQHYGLPTFEEKDAVYAYHFYRLLQRCTAAVVTYNTDPNAMGGGEASRFVVQLEIELKNTACTVLPRRFEQGPVHQNSIEAEFSAPRTPAVREAIAEWMQRGISASALGEYCSYPDQFYQRRLIQVREEEEVEESLNAMMMGNLVHKALELKYGPYVGQKLPEFDPQIWAEDALELGITHLIEVEKYSRSTLMQGRNLVTVEVCRQMLYQFFTYERERMATTPITVLALEHLLEYTHPHPTLGFDLKFKGFVDRVELAGQTPIIWDYKTGTIGASDLSLGALEDLWNGNKNKPIQVLLYAWLLWKTGAITKPFPWQSGMFKLRSGQPEYKLRGRALGGTYVYDIDQQLLEDFEAELMDFLEELLHSDEPFVAKPKEDRK